MKVEPGEVVVLRPPKDTVMDIAKELYEVGKKAFPDNRVVIFRPDCEVKNYDKEEFLTFLETLKRQVEGG